MAYVKAREYNELVKRVEALEERLGSVAIPSIEYVLDLNEFYGDDAALFSETEFRTVDQVKLASDDALLAIKGLGPAALRRIRAKE
jgi:hypothetical protein